MRHVPPFRCPADHVAAERPGMCSRCGARLVDAHGRPSQLLHLGDHPITAISGALVTLSGVAAIFLSVSVFFVALERVRPILTSRVGIGAAIAWVFFGLGVWFWRRWQRQGGGRSWHARRVRAAMPLRPIGQCETGRCRVRGRVRVLDAVAGEQPTVAAVYRRCLEPFGDGSSSTLIRDVMQCGRFAVVDESGVAVVDDDAFLFWSLESRLPSDAAGELLLSDGDEVEVIGPARWGAPTDALVHAPGHARTYRGGQALVFDGSATAPLLILST